MMIWITVAIVVAVAATMLLVRRDLARMQAMIFGGAIVPGCVVAEAVALLVVAAVIVFFERSLR